MPPINTYVYINNFGHTYTIKTYGNSYNAYEILRKNVKYIETWDLIQ